MKLIPTPFRRIIETKNQLRALIVGEKAELYYTNLKKKEQKQKFEVCKADILSTAFWTELEYLKTIMFPLLLFMRDNDGNCSKPAGNPIGHAYFNFWQLDNYYRLNKSIQNVHRKGLSEVVNARWVFGHNLLHSAGFMVHPAYKQCKQTTNEDVMTDWYTLLDMWVEPDTKILILRQYVEYKQGRGMFNRAETSSMTNDPIAFWSCFGCGTPELQSLAIKILEQSTSASACETNWSQYEYIFNNETAEKLVYIHGNLRSIANCGITTTTSTSTGSSLTEYLDSTDSTDADQTDM